MIEFANENTASLVRQMWKTCFNDTDEFLDIHFSYKYRNENTLIYFEEDKAVASLQMLPYTMTFYRDTIPFAYLAGLCTLPEYRRKGYMEQLIHEAHKVIADRGIPLSILIPAEDWLYGFYEKYDYEQVFQKDNDIIPLKDILCTYTNEDEAYEAYDSLFRYKDFCVQKSKEDFRAIIADYRLDNYPPKANLSGMAHIIDIWSLLKLYAKDNLSKEFRLKIKDDLSGESITYRIERGQVELILSPGANYDIEVDKRLLCRLLFGFRTKELSSAMSGLFDEHYPIMNLMLE